MTDKEKLKKIVSLADKMYDAAFKLTTDASLLKKAMDDYHQFIIHEYHKEEPVSELLNIESMIESYKQRLISQANGVNNSPLVNMCLASYKHGINETLETLKLSNVERTIKHWKEEPVSDDLEEAADKYATGYNLSGLYKITEAFKAGAKWQKEKEYTCYEEAFEDGASWKKEQMMKDAVDATVHIDAGNYPYIPQIELYDYDKDIPLTKEGDKYKVILIKED